MKKVQYLFVAAALLFCGAVRAQQDFSGPQYAKWGDTVEERQKNILSSNFLKEACDNKDYNAAAQHFMELVQNAPSASENTYVRGALLYKNKINRAKSLAEKEALVDSLLWTYDLRVQYFGGHPTRGRAYILDRKAREYLTYRPNDRAGIRRAFRDAIEAGGAATDPSTLVAYFSNLCADYKDTDEIMPDEVISEYERLTPFFGADAAEFRSQFDMAFGMSNAASCENLEKLFRAKLETAPEDEAVLAQAFQNKGDYAKASKYLNEALEVETDPAEQQKLYVRIALVELAANHIPGAAAAARSARDLNPEDGVPYFVLAQCYGVSAGQCGGFAGQAAFWVAYDTMARAIELLPSDSEYLDHARTSLSLFRNRFPTSEECFFNEATEGSRYTVSCGTAAGLATTVRFR